MVIVNESQLITVSDSAADAFNAFDFGEHDGKAVRVYVAGFG